MISKTTKLNYTARGIDVERMIKITNLILERLCSYRTMSETEKQDVGNRVFVILVNTERIQKV